MSLGPAPRACSQARAAVPLPGTSERLGGSTFAPALTARERIPGSVPTPAFARQLRESRDVPPRLLKLLRSDCDRRAVGETRLSRAAKRLAIATYPV